MAEVVETTSGKVEGVREREVVRFRGIPYAAPPTGALRFTPPRPPAAWAGVRDASQYGHSAPQPPSVLPGMAPGVQGEDCLVLNVYTPAADTRKRPVMVWIHGGAFTGGSGGQALYEGAPLTRRGDIVLVTINYRLGALGYLHLAQHADRLPGAASNLGQRDQVAALEWVRDNIASFGGDPERVTIFGESAGGMAVSTLLAMPAAKGLFHGVIAQSGATHATHGRESAERVLEALLDELSIAPGEIEKLRAVPVDTLTAAQFKAGQRVAAGVFLPYAPAIDPETLPRHPLDVVRSGGARDIRLIVGANRDEWKLFSAMNPAHFQIDESALQKIVAARLSKLPGADAGHVIDSYRAARPDAAPHDLLDAIETDRLFRIPAIRLAEAQLGNAPSTWNYYFTWPSPARRGALGACHALELPFVFGSLAAPTMDRFAGKGPEAEALSANMMDAWLAFAHNREPACDSLPAWAPYDPVRRATMIFDRECGLALAPDERERAVWDGLL